MKRVWKILRWLVIVLACLFLVAQFIRPAKTNPPTDQMLALESRTGVTPQVTAILDRSCTDCHSNKTRWPWYANVAPVSWLVIDDVNEARQDMNFSEWGRYDLRDQAAKLNQICREVSAGAMPLASYRPMHPGSKLSAEDVKTLCDWTSAERSRIAVR
jgi:hypothetical protein